MLVIYTGYYLKDKKVTLDFMFDDLDDDETIMNETTTWLLDRYDFTEDVVMRSNNHIFLDTCMTVMYEKGLEDLLQIVYIGKDHKETVMTISKYGYIENFVPDFGVVTKNLLLRRLSKTKKRRENEN